MERICKASRSEDGAQLGEAWSDHFDSSSRFFVDIVLLILFLSHQVDPLWFGFDVCYHDGRRVAIKVPKPPSRFPSMSSTAKAPLITTRQFQNLSTRSLLERDVS